MQATLISCLAVISAVGQYSTRPISKDELAYQKQAFEHWWGQELQLKLDELPAEGKVADSRVPYSGFDYPDRAGGTMQAMVKYDRAFHSNRMLAADWERRDVGIHKSPRDLRSLGEFGPPVRFGLIARIRAAARAPRTPTWYGHCNGWTAAAIRHAEPQRSVTRNGVVFSPADIKGLLAEIYMYSETEFLGGVDTVIHPGVLHLTLTNWLGRGSHPVGMESAIGEVVINYPIYSYKAKITNHSDRMAEVALTATYAMNTNRETNESVRYNRQAIYHYGLDLDADGQIVGGRYYSDSAHIDMLWAPLQPVQGGKKGNERGNPHVDVDEVLAIWRESVPEHIRKEWLNIDPTEEDRLELDDKQVASTELKPENAPEKKEVPEPPAEVPAAESTRTPAADRPDDSP
jgi:hypothetical protein